MANGFYGGGIGQLLDSLAQAGFFTYVLPFLVIFALVYGILVRTKLFKENNAINVIISLAVAIMALQFGFVSVFFSEVFPRLGVALAVILVVLILLSLFLPKQNWVIYALLVVAVIATGAVLLNASDATFGAYGGGNIGAWFAEYWPWLALGIFVAIVLISIVMSSTGRDPPEYAKILSPLLESLGKQD